MKKLVTMLLAAVLVVSCVACGNAEDKDTQAPSTEVAKENTKEKVEIKNSVELLSKVWEEYLVNAPDDFQFIIYGGNMEAELTDEVATFSLMAKGAKTELATYYGVPEGSVKLVDDAATLMHAEASDEFAAAVLHVKDAKNVEKVVSSITATDGQVRKTMVVGDNYVVVISGNKSIVKEFEEALNTVYGKAIAK